MVATLALEEVLGKLGQLPGTKQRVAIDQEGRQHLEIAMLPGMNIQHEAGQRPLQPGAQAPVDGKARTRDLGRPLEVENAQALAQLPMRLGRKIESRRLAPAQHLHVIRFALSRGHAVLGQVGDSHQKRAHGFFRLGRASLQLFRLLLQLPGLIHDCCYLGRVRACLAAARHLLAEPVALRLQVSAWVMRERRSRSSSRKLPSRAAGSMPRARSFSSTSSRLARTKFKSSISLYFTGFSLDAAKLYPVAACVGSHFRDCGEVWPLKGTGFQPPEGS